MKKTTRRIRTGEVQLCDYDKSLQYFIVIALSLRVGSLYMNEYNLKVLFCRFKRVVAYII